MKSVKSNRDSAASQWGFYFDQTRCVNCKTCVLACKNWNENARGDAVINPGLRWLEDDGYAEPAQWESSALSEGGQNYAELRKYHMKENWRRVTATEYGEIPPEVDVLNISLSCNHCQTPACVAVCPTGRIFKEPEFGIVLVNPSQPCIACGACRLSCPWGSPQFYDDDLKKYPAGNLRRPVMTKCNLCIDRIRQGLKPACVAACIMRALDAGPIEELKIKHPDWVDRVENFPSDHVSGLAIRTGPNIIFKMKIRKNKEG